MAFMFITSPQVIGMAFALSMIENQFPISPALGKTNHTGSVDIPHALPASRSAYWGDGISIAGSLTVSIEGTSIER
jgi:hypothetical protein